LKQRIVIFILIVFFLLIAGIARSAEFLTWYDCVKEAIENNPELIAVREKVIQSRADKNISVSSVSPDSSVK